MIDRYLLRYFLAVMDQGNFSRAALHCRVSQPTLSVGVAKLEAAVGHALFVRTNRRVELTPAGTRFAVHARRIEAEFAQAERILLDDAPRTPIRLGVISSLPSTLIGSAIEAARAAGTDERIELVEGRARDLAPLLDRGRLDAVLGLVSEDGRGCERGRVLFREGYAMAMATGHPLAHRSSVSAEDLAGETMIVRRHCEALPDISRFFTSRGVRPFMAARTTNDDRALAYVRAGLGITVMPRCFATEGVAMLDLAGFSATRAIGFRFRGETAARFDDSAILSCIAEALAAATVS